MKLSWYWLSRSLVFGCMVASFYTSVLHSLIAIRPICIPLSSWPSSRTYAAYDKRYTGWILATSAVCDIRQAEKMNHRSESQQYETVRTYLGQGRRDGAAMEANISSTSMMRRKDVVGRPRGSDQTNHRPWSSRHPMSFHPPLLLSCTAWSSIFKNPVHLCCTSPLSATFSPHCCSEYFFSCPPWLVLLSSWRSSLFWRNCPILFWLLLCPGKKNFGADENASNSICIKSKWHAKVRRSRKGRAKKQPCSSHGNSLSQFESTMWMHSGGDRGMRVSRSPFINK